MPSAGSMRSRHVPAGRATEPGGTGPEIVIDVVIDDTTYERTRGLW